jgi:hypothetical protein
LLSRAVLRGRLKTKAERAELALLEFFDWKFRNPPPARLLSTLAYHKIEVDEPPFFSALRAQCKMDGNVKLKNKWFGDDPMKQNTRKSLWLLLPGVTIVWMPSRLLRHL